MPTVAGVSASGNWILNGPVVADLPAGIAAGQTLICGTFVRSAAQTIDPPTGDWTLVSDPDVTGTNTTAEIAVKVAGGSETAPTLDATDSGQGLGGVIVAVAGGTDVVVAANTGGGNTLPAPSIDDVPAGSLILRWYFNADNNTISDDTAAGGSQIFTELSDVASDLALHIYADTQTETGPTGTAQLVPSGSDGYVSFTVAVFPAAAESETATLTAVLPAATAAFTGHAEASAAMAGNAPTVTGTFTAAAGAAATATGTLPDPVGSFTATATATAALAGVLPVPVAALTAAAEGAATATLTAVLAAATSSFTAAASASATLAGTLPATEGAFTAAPPGVAPTPASMAAAVTATRTSGPSVTTAQTEQPAVTAATTATATAAAVTTQASGVA